MRHCIKEPIPEIFAAWDAISAAVDEHLKGNRTRAEELFRQADSPAVWSWLNTAWVGVIKNVVEMNPPGDTKVIPRSERDPDRNIAPHVRAAVLKRDGYRCRYCGIPVVQADIRKIATKLYPESVGWDSRDPSKQHAGFQCLWLQYDHVEPHSHGGKSSIENVVISCALCNFGKDRFTLRQLRIVDPRLREPEHVGYDGLERLRAWAIPMMRPPKAKKSEVSLPHSVQPTADAARYFIPGAWVSSGHLLTPVIDGKSRWFKLSDEVQAEPAVRDGLTGCLLICRPELLSRRGINADQLLDAFQTARERIPARCNSKGSQERRDDTCEYDGERSDWPSEPDDADDWARNRRSSRR